MIRIRKSFRENATRVLLAVTLAAASISVSSCGGSGGGFFGGIANIVGQAFRPVSELIDANPIPLGEAPVTLIEFAGDTLRTAQTNTVVGTTDANGFYDVSVNGQPIVAVVVNGTVDGQAFRSSGLVVADGTLLGKDFNGVTDVACESLIGSINMGRRSSRSVTQSDIDNLEAAARTIVSTVDFTDPTSVTRAARTIADMTNDGMNPPSTTTPEDDTTPVVDTTPVDDTTGTLGCQTTETTCADGFPICAELVCNGTQDCADGSDEDPSVCGEESSCCSATNGCPGETGTSCSDECCCCALNAICDQGNFANGCVAARTGRGDGGDSALSKLIVTGVYY